MFCLHCLLKFIYWEQGYILVAHALLHKAGLDVLSGVDVALED
jgi:hypothetical protein